MAKSITEHAWQNLSTEVLCFIETHGYAIYCLMNQINMNSTIANSHHIQKI